MIRVRLGKAKTHLENGQKAQIAEADGCFAVLRQGPSRCRDVDLLHQLIQNLKPDHVVIVRRLRLSPQVFDVTIFVLEGAGVNVSTEYCTLSMARSSFAPLTANCSQRN